MTEGMNDMVLDREATHAFNKDPERYLLKWLLADARARLDNPGNWCRRDFAIDKNGKGVRPDEQQAVAWCATGSIERSGSKLATAQDRLRLEAKAWRILNRLADEHYSANGRIVTIEYVNDAYRDGHRRVLELYDDALDALPNMDLSTL